MLLIKHDESSNNTRLGTKLGEDIELLEGDVVADTVHGISLI